MNAVETIERLVKLGTLVSTAASDAKAQDKSIDWNKFIESDVFKTISDGANKLLDGLKQNDIDKAIARLETKQRALLGGRTVEDLPLDKVIQYAQLSDVKIVLRAKKVAAAADPPFLAWLVDEALPVLLKSGPAVLPLIL